MVTSERPGQGRLSAAPREECASPHHRRLFLQVARRPVDGSPHVRAGAVVKTQPFRRLAEITPNDVRELLELDVNVWIKRVEIVDRQETGRAVPSMIAAVLVSSVEIGLGFVVGTGQTDVTDGR